MSIASKKVGYCTDSDGQRLEYAYWQASREVPAEMLPRGLSRKRVTGSGKSSTEALTRLGENWEAFEKGEFRRGKTRLSGKATVRTLFAEWNSNNKAGAVSATMAWKYESMFEHHVLPYIGDRRLDSLREEDLLTLFNHTLAQKTDDQGRLVLQAKSRRNIYMALSGCLKYGVRQHYVAVNSLEAVKPPRKEAPKDDIDAVLVESRKVMNAVQSGDDPDEARWLLAFLGLRRGERPGRRTRHTRTHPRKRLNSNPHISMPPPVRATLTTQTASSPDRTRPSGSATAPRCGPNRVPGRSRRG